MSPVEHYDYMECDACRAKPGAPDLCRGCLHNRTLFFSLLAPIPMILYCRVCGVQHVDKDEWVTRPHSTHLCESCGHTWRPCNRSTVGVESL